ncbi:hypothetical protein HFO42_19725 [Rhizobium leguminosarum]|uniref:Uncharacterized protein n=1 Tax=Rhizobium leguminosarum TaxID=384 RepID=A0AAJ1A9X7_RHILE|nr:hypothetical protein [Rhizobium leguminosarum]MBY5535920.1 hypothetical protein [Rhizobium leguminosarum]MBY5597277.1 hypothetical protein [Rhizobium leguminosarum]MBY5617274.1 hypothetical protein [Rhizobium leguminosarum]MBY5630319.1 hypothetical protein [Rhizobium leguminosarum]MBY5732671.1 hypothetical protein [Rhizobium leguminosarum]
MTEVLYVVTADIMNREEDGRDQQDGSTVYRSYSSRETWVFPASMPIGEIMTKVNDVGGYVVSVTVTEDRVSAEIAREERIAASRQPRAIQLD